MPFITYNNGIPATANNPSVDQPDMATNTDAIDTILQVDHISFNDNQGGLHQQVTFNNKNAAGAQTDPESVIFTASGAASSVSEVFFRNQNTTFPLSAIKAAGVFTTQQANGVIVPSNSYNVTSVTSSSVGIVNTVVLGSNVTTGNNVIVLCNLSNDGSIQWAFVGGTLTFTINAASALSKILSFAVLQF